MAKTKEKAAYFNN